MLLRDRIQRVDRNVYGETDLIMELKAVSREHEMPSNSNRLIKN